MIGRWLRTARHLKPAQVWHRGRYTLRRLWWQQTSPAVDARYRERARQLGMPRWDSPAIARLVALRKDRRTIEERTRVADDALVGRFTFLNRSEDLGAEVAWQRPDLDRGTRLWKTMLHEHGYAEDLAFCSKGHDAYRARFEELVASWSAAHPIGCRDFARDVWNARAVANRMLSWTVAAHALELDASSLGAHIAAHALFLRDNLEWDLGHNHLIRDLLGLILAGELFPDTAFGRDGIVWLEQQVADQILADGCHVERTPLYHAIVLGDLVEARALLGDRAPAWLHDAIARMAWFLRHVLHGDGDLPLFGDSWLGEIDCARVLAEAGPTSEPASHGASGLVAIEAGAAKLVMRAGAHGPDHQLGHAHADLLSFELSHGAHRIVSDTGTGTYDEGPIRARSRSTAAHNTIQIDGVEQLEAWASFRVGRRGRADIVARGEQAGFGWLWARHDAYQRLPGAPRHHRLVALRPEALLVLDAIAGEGRHSLSSRLHLHPDRPLDLVRIEALGGQAITGDAPFYERFGAPERTLTALNLTRDGALPFLGGWLVLIGPSAADGAIHWEPYEDGAQLRYEGPGFGFAARWRVWRESQPKDAQLMVKLEVSGA